jgi:TRAP-type C4-dicarboxylate transport system permease small subunit
LRRLTISIDRILDRLSLGLTHVASIGLVLLVVLVNVDIFARYLLNRSTMIADEYGGYLFVWITMLGVLHTLRAERFLNVMFVVERLSPRGRNLLGISAAGIGFVVCAILAYGTIRLVNTSVMFGTRSIQYSGTPLVWPQLILPVGFVLLCVAYLQEIARRSLGVARQDSQPEITDLPL